MKSFWQKLDGRLLLLVLLPMVPALALIFYSDFEQRNLRAIQVKQEAVQAAELGAVNQQALIEGIRQLQASLAQLPHYRGTNAAFYRMNFTNVMRLYPYYLNYGLVETNGTVFVSAIPFQDEVNLRDRIFFQQVLKTRGFAVGDFAREPGTGRACLYFGCPIEGPNGEVARVLYAALDLEALNHTVSRVVLPAEAALVVLDRNGQVLAGSPAPTNVGEDFGLDPSLFQTMLNRGPGAWERKEADGKRKLYAYTPVGMGKAAGTYVVVKIPKEIAYAAANQILLRNLLLFGVVLISALWAARRYAHRHILRPVDALVRASKEITEGDLGARTGLPKGPGQLSQLAASFDEMAETLELRREELHQAEAKFRILVEQSLVGIYVIQGENFVYVNPKLAELVGYETREIVGRPVLEYIAPESRGTVQDNIKKRMTGEIRSAHYMLALQKKDREIIQAEVHGVRTEYDGRPAIIGTLLDITDRVRAEAEIHRLNASLEQRVIERTAQLEAANKELEAFSYSVSHDLRAPLRHINGYVEMLREDAGGSLNDECLRYLDVMSNSTKQMGQLIDDLLAFSKMSRIEMQHQQVNFTQLVEETRGKLELETEGRNVVWKQGNLPEVEGDPAMFRQVWVNLLSNAVKYTRPRDPAEIEIGCKESGADETVFYVKDNGVGFDMQYVQKLFGVFQRLHRPTEFEGTGIGLAIVQRIIQRHGGRIWVEAKQDEGATFYFSLPKLVPAV
jgi:PAS domain S-box-containing protein